MAQISNHPIPKNISDRIFEIFLNTFTRLRDKQEADQFMSDLLTPTEKIMLSKRLAIAFLLENKYEYRSIQQILKVSTGTITSVNLALRHGSIGYKKVIGKILKEEALVNFLKISLVKLLSAPSSLERGRGAWTYLKDKAKKDMKNKRKAF